MCLMTRSKSRKIEPAASRQYPRAQISTRNTSASRNRHNSPVFNHLTFSTRNKMTIRRRIVTLSDQRESKGLSLSVLISNRNNAGNRNRRNPLGINHLTFSNRNKLGGLPLHISAPCNESKRAPFAPPRPSHLESLGSNL